MVNEGLPPRLMRAGQHTRLLAAVGSALGGAGPYQESPVPSAPADPPGRQVLAGAVDQSQGSTGRVAWVEDTVDAYRDGVYLGCEVALHVAGGGLGHQRIRLYHYNPYFGTDVHLIRFQGDSLLVVYREKHHTFIARVTSPWTDIRQLIRIGDDYTIQDDLVVYVMPFEDLLHHLRFPDLAPTLPLPLPASQGVNIELAIEEGPDGVLVHWSVRRLRLPTAAQSAFPTDRAAIWAGLRAVLGGPDAPTDGPDVLIATAGLPFWYAGNNTRQRRGPSTWELVASYWQFLHTDTAAGGAGQPDEAARWLAWLDRLASGTDYAHKGWDPTWNPTEGAVQLALGHIRQRAAQLATACRSGGFRTRFGFDPIDRRIKDTRADPAVSPIDLPEGFVRVWTRLAREQSHPQRPENLF